MVAAAAAARAPAVVAADLPADAGGAGTLRRRYHCPDPHSLKLSNRIPAMYQAQQARLSAKKAELEDRIARLARDARHADEPVEKDFEEQATQREGEEVTTELLNESRRELQQISRALLRMDSGDYGICANCGADIGEGRLNAVPEATHCIKCAK